MKDKLAKQLNTAAMTTKMTTEKKGENKAGAASTPPSPPPPPVAVVIKGGKNATTSLSPTGTLRGYWQAEEETALRAAVQKHGIGAWEKMRTDPDFKALRCARYIFYRDERRATAFLRVLLVVFVIVFSFSRFLVFVLCAVMMMRETQTRQIRDEEGRRQKTFFFDEISSKCIWSISFQTTTKFLLCLLLLLLV
jgi:hypothetical protein